MDRLVHLRYTKMAKFTALLLLVCFEFSKQDEVAAVEKSKDIVPAEFAFPEQELIQETYPLDISLDNEKGSTEGDDDFFQLPQDPWAAADELYDQMWEDYTDVTLAVEEWIMRANPSMRLYKWLKVLEEGSVVKGTVPRCSGERVSIYDYYDRNVENSWLNSESGDPKLMEEYSKLVLDIEKWMAKAHPKMSHYKWLRAVEKGTEASCVDYDASSYDYYYDTDIKTYIGDKESYEKKLLTPRKFKRFTSV